MIFTLNYSRFFRLMLFGFVAQALLPSLSCAYVSGRNCELIQGGVRHSIPCEVELSDQFRWPNLTQRWGVCHIHAATALVEAACKRLHGLDVDLSEAYHYYRHVRRELLETSSLKREELHLAVTGQADHPQFEIGGFAEQTVERILRGDACSEEEFAGVDRFISDFERISGSESDRVHDREFRERTEWALERSRLGIDPSRIETEEWYTRLKLDSRNRQFPASLATALDEYALERSQGRRSSLLTWKAGIRVKTANPSLGRCLSTGLTLHREEASTLGIIKLLARGVPVLCEGHRYYGVGRSGAHVTVLIGYRGSKSTPSGLNFLERDSNLSDPSLIEAPGSPCTRAYSIR